MQDQQQVYHLRVDSSERIVLPAEARERNHIAHGDTVTVVEDHQGLHINAREQIKAEVWAEARSLHVRHHGTADDCCNPDESYPASQSGP